MNIEEGDHEHVIAMAKSRGLNLVTITGASGCDLEVFHKLRITYAEYQRNRRVAEEFMRAFCNIWILGPTIVDLKAVNEGINLDSFNCHKIFPRIADQVQKEKEDDVLYGYIPVKIVTTLNECLPACYTNLWFSTDYVLDGYVDVRDDVLMRKVAETVELASKNLEIYFQSPEFIEDLDQRGFIVHPPKRRQRSSKSKRAKRTKN